MLLILERHHHVLKSPKPPDLLPLLKSPNPPDPLPFLGIEVVLVWVRLLELVSGSSDERAAVNEDVLFELWYQLMTNSFVVCVVVLTLPDLVALTMKD